MARSECQIVAAVGSVRRPMPPPIPARAQRCRPELQVPRLRWSTSSACSPPATPQSPDRCVVAVAGSSAARIPLGALGPPAATLQCAGASVRGGTRSSTQARYGRRGRAPGPAEVPLLLQRDLEPMSHRDARGLPPSGSATSPSYTARCAFTSSHGKSRSGDSTPRISSSRRCRSAQRAGWQTQWRLHVPQSHSRVPGKPPVVHCPAG